MKQSGQCPKCGSDHVIADARAIDRGHLDVENEFSVSTFAKPDAWIFKDRRASNVSAWVCGDCGLVELYADNPAALERGAHENCLRCGAPLGRDTSACGQCGWTWDSTPG